MSVGFDSSPQFQQFAHPEKLVSAEWLSQNLDTDGLVVVESNEDVLLYETGHIPGAVKIDWHTELNDPVRRDYLDGEAFAELMSRKGIRREDTVVFYGDMNNWWATYALWVFELFGHSDVRILDGGRDKWIADGREMTREKPAITETTYPVIERDDTTLRAFRDEVLAEIGKQPLIDVRSVEEYRGDRTSAPHLPEEGALRAGHIPTAQNVPWAQAVQADGTFKPLPELNDIYRHQANIGDSDNVIVYCRIGERSSHTWFTLKYLLGIDSVKNYDGSWTEWGSSVGVPIVRGEDAGTV